MTLVNLLLLGALSATPHIDGSIEDTWRSQPPLIDNEHYSVWERATNGKRWIAVRSDRPTPVLIVVAGDSSLRLLLVSSTAALAEYRYSGAAAWLTRKYQYFVDSDELRQKFNRRQDESRDWQASHGTEGRPGEYEAWISTSPEEKVFISFYTLRDGLISAPRSPASAATLDSWIRGLTPERIEVRL